MNLSESLRISLRALMANKLRTALTVSGIVIGSFLIFVLLSVGGGSTREAKKLVSDLAPNAVAVVHGYFPVDVGLGEVTFSPSEMLQQMEEAGTELPLLGSRFEPEMAYTLERDLPTGCAITPMSMDIRRVEFGSRTRNAFVFATNEDYPRVRDQSLLRGRYFCRSDEGRRVCVLGSYLSSMIFGDIDPIGREVRISGKRFQVVGVMEPRGTTFLVNNDDFLYLPYWVGGHLGGAKTDGFLISAPDPERMREAKAVCVERLEELVGEKTFTVVTQEEMMALADDYTRIFNVMNTVVILVALIVGGIGIMNIMLVAVSERVREIGIRKAVGARSSDILKQFIMESVLLGTAGGIAGIVAGLGFIEVVAAVFDYPPYTSLGSMTLALLFSLAVGVVFGVWPAMKAAAMDPVEALGHEL